MSTIEDDDNGWQEEDEMNKDQMDDAALQVAFNAAGAEAVQILCKLDIELSREIEGSAPIEDDSNRITIDLVIDEKMHKVRLLIQILIETFEPELSARSYGEYRRLIQENVRISDVLMLKMLKKMSAASRNAIAWYLVKKNEHILVLDYEQRGKYQYVSQLQESIDGLYSYLAFSEE